MSSDLSQKVSLGTTIMACVFKDGVVIGADSRTSTGSYVANRVTDKLTMVDDYIYCCRSGSAADTQAVADIVRYYLQMHSVEHNEKPDVKTAAVMFQQLCYSNKDYLSAGIIVAGWDKHNGASVYNIPLGGSLHQAPFAIGGSGSTYIYGYCDANFREGFTREECLEFVRNSVGLAISRDGSSGGVIRTAVITEAGVERETLPGNKIPTFWQG